MKALPTWSDTYGRVWTSEATQARPVVSLAAQKGFFLLFRLSSGMDWYREYLLPFSLRVTDSDGAIRLCRMRPQTHNKHFDLKTMINVGLGLLVSVVFVDLFITETTTTMCTVYARRLHQEAPSHRIKSSSHCLRHPRTHAWSNATVLTVFSMLFLCWVLNKGGSAL